MSLISDQMNSEHLTLELETSCPELRKTGLRRFAVRRDLKIQMGMHQINLTYGMTRVNRKYDLKLKTYQDADE